MHAHQSILLGFVLLGLVCNAKPDTYTVCTSSRPSLVTCEHGSPRGLEIEEFDEIAGEMGWVLATNETGWEHTQTHYRYKCMDIGSVLEDLKRPDGECDIATSQSVTEEWVDEGYRYSFPVGRSRMHLLMDTDFPNTEVELTSMYKLKIWISPSDLAGMNISTLAIFKQPLTKFLRGRKTNISTWEANENTIDHALESLASSPKNGWVMPEPWVSTVMKHFGCDRNLISFQTDIPLDHALIFGRKASREFLTEVNLAIIRLTQEGKLMKLYNDFVRNGHKKCASNGQDEVGSMGYGSLKALAWDGVWLVWVIVFGLIVCAVILSCNKGGN